MAIGMAMGARRQRQQRTRGARRLESARRFGPAKAAEGMISPKNRTRVTERITVR